MEWKWAVGIAARFDCPQMLPSLHHSITPSLRNSSLTPSAPTLHTARPTATEVARVTAEYAKYAEAGSEPLSISFPRISRIPRFNPCDDRASVQIFAAREQIGLLQCKEFEL